MAIGERPSSVASPSDLPAATLWHCVLWLLRRRKRFRVNGLSMYPLLKHGEEVLVDLNAYQASCPMLGDIVVASHPDRAHFHLIKRIGSPPMSERLSLHDGYWLEGDNPDASTDSRAFGPVPEAAIFGKVVCRFF